MLYYSGISWKSGVFSDQDGGSYIFFIFLYEILGKIFVFFLSPTYILFRQVHLQYPFGITETWVEYLVTRNHYQSLVIGPATKDGGLLRSGTVPQTVEQAC